ncbi:hypothetical protein K7432_018054 [Basidiobolus ranarum]|uniref:Uncharacterized protein n=1 Tax=Basidiobolus ranarum TaxID=34480 RepID=A0ABR2WCM1_9FUNG
MVVEQEQKTTANFMVKVIITLVKITVAFVPVVELALSITIGVAYSKASGDTDPLEYILAAAGAISDLVNCYKLCTTFNF